MTQGYGKMTALRSRYRGKKRVETKQPVCNTQTTANTEHKTALKELPFSNPLSGRRLTGDKKKPTRNDAESVAQRGNNCLQYANNSETRTQNSSEGAAVQ